MLKEDSSGWQYSEKSKPNQIKQSSYMVSEKRLWDFVHSTVLIRNITFSLIEDFQTYFFSLP